MNERIKELRAKAQELACEQHYTGRSLDLKGMEQVPDFQIFMDRVHTSYEKFAELIVRQMLEITDAHTEVFQTDRDRAVIEHIKKSVRQHFGVEE